MVSSGVRELDALLGGGHVLGTALALEEDQHSTHALSLLGYALAEGISQGQSVLVVLGSERGTESVLEHAPYNLTMSEETHAAEVCENDVLVCAHARLRTYGWTDMYACVGALLSVCARTTIYRRVADGGRRYHTRA
jgi:hypothetical protein